MADPCSTERRRLRRHVRRIPATYRANGAEARGYVKNISREGLFLRVDPTPEPGTHVEVVIEPERGPKVEVTGEVRWTTGQLPDGIEAQPGFGMRLDVSTPEFQELLEGILLH